MTHKISFILAALVLLTFLNCNAETQRTEAETRAYRISQLKSDTATIQNPYKSHEDKMVPGNHKNTLGEAMIPCTENIEGDKIIGIWEIDNNNYKASYEVIKFEEQYFGKIYYYNDGGIEIKTQNNKDDYFLEGIFYADGNYTEGKMYLTAGNYCKVKLHFKGNQLSVAMTIDGEPYSETWNRKKLKQ